MAIQRIRDPLHDLIEFDTGDQLEAALWRVLQTRPLQRLRRIKQLGFSELVYPGASHTRLVHSIGVFHTARQLMKVVHKIHGATNTSREWIALAAALVHDVGHGPFSHAFEKVGERLGLKLADHEHVSDLVIRDGEISSILNQISSGFAIDVADMIKKDGRITVHNSIVSSQFDADRLDYMRRDRLMTGTQHSAIDFSWLLANLEVAAVPFGVEQEQVGTVETFVIKPKAIHAAEAYVLGLFQLYPTVYFHKATRGAEKIFTELLVRIIELTRDGRLVKTGLSNKHPISRFALDPENIENALSLDDSVVWGSIPFLAEAEDPLIKEFSVRLRDRNLYKCFDIRTLVSHAIDRDNLGDDSCRLAIDACCVTIGKKLTEWAQDNSSDSPRLILDEASRSPYREGGGSKGPTEQINVRTDHGSLIDLKRRSKVVAGLADFSLFRAYYPREDQVAQKAVSEIVDAEIRYASK